MTPAPTLHTFDPQIAGKIGLYIDPQGLVVGDQVAWYVSNTSGGPYSQPATTFVHGGGLDGLTLVFDANGPFYCVAKAASSGVWSAYSNEVQATPSPGAPVLTAQQALVIALGETIDVGDQVALYAQPSVVKTVQPDGSLA